MRYSQTFIDELKRQADIVRVIQDYVSLKKKGANWMACCPFHKEKTPSFSVSPAKEIFYCFGCHKGGSVFNFVMEMERVSFPEAIQLVAEKSGVPLPKLVDDSHFEARRQEADDVIQLNKWALEWWERLLEQGGSESRIGRDYLSQREITDETRKTFRMGIAPDSWDALSSHLKQKGATQLQIERSGLVVKKDEGGSYDRFRGRLIVPVMDIQGRPIAFGGRTLKNEDAKYINSPETAAYVKGRNLFGLNLTRDEIRKQGFAILVEGFLDLIVPYQFGVCNLVASLGTALTPDQVKLLARFARKVVVNYDGDQAGVQAAKKAIEILLTEDLEVKVLVLPDNADPDEFIRKSGASEFQRRRGEAQPHIQFVIDQAVRDRNLRNPPEKEAAIEEALPYVLAVRSSIQQDEYFEIVMDGLRVPVGQRPRYRQRIIESRRKFRSGSAEKGIVEEPKIELTTAEERLLRLLLIDDELRRGILPILKPDDYEDLRSADIFRALIEIGREGVQLDPERLFRQMEGDKAAIALIQKFLMSDSPGSWDLRSRETLFVSEREAPEKCVDTFRLMKVQRQIDEVRAELADAERAGDTEKVLRLSAEQTELELQRKALQPRTEAATTLN